MGSGNDPVESFFNSIQAIEVGIRKAAKDLEHCWPGPKNNKVNGVQVIAQVSEDGMSQICGVKKKNGQCVVIDERKKGLTKKVPLKALFGMFSQNPGNGNKAEVFGRGTKEKEVSKEDEACTNCLRFAVTWSVLFNGFLQTLPNPFKSSKKRFQKTGDEDRLCSLKPTVSCESKGNNHFAKTSREKGGRQKEEKHVHGHASLECLIGFIFDQLSQTLQDLDQGAEENHRDCDRTSLPLASSPHFDHLKALGDILEGHKVNVNGFLGNLRFAKVGVPTTSSVVGVSPSAKEDGNGNGSSSVENREESGGSSAQRVATNLLSIPLSNVERIKSSLSTISLSELIELLPQLGRSSKDHPDKKKLISVQDFFRYTEAEGKVFFKYCERPCMLLAWTTNKLLFAIWTTDEDI